MFLLFLSHCCFPKVIPKEVIGVSESMRACTCSYARVWICVYVWDDVVYTGLILTVFFFGLELKIL